MGRPPIKPDTKVTRITVWMHDDTVKAVRAIVGTQGTSGYIRQLIEADLLRRERLAKRKAKTPPQ